LAILVLFIEITDWIELPTKYVPPILTERISFIILRPSSLAQALRAKQSY